VEHPTVKVEPLATDAASPPEDQLRYLDGIIVLAISAWRLSRLALRSCEKLDPQDGTRLESQVRYIDQQVAAQLDQHGIRLVTLDGQKHDPGMAATALNADEFGLSDDLIVLQTLEPIVVGPAGVLKSGVMMLGRAKA
jgi:hypothetical protein